MRPRIIVMLHIMGGGVYQTTGFGKSKYIGDPINTATLLNDLEVDELVVVDGGASKNSRGPDFKLMDKLRSRCFFPVSYGGGVNSLEAADALFKMGIEKVILNSVLFSQPELFAELTQKYGSQSVVLNIDVKRNWLGKNKVYSHTKARVPVADPMTWIRYLLALATPGEVLLTNVNRNGSYMGYELELLKRLVTEFPDLPVVINGGAASLQDMVTAVAAGAHACSASSMFVFKNNGVLINYPEQLVLRNLFDE
ncbi:HisA/HisF-related TIM barrel protein [Planctobacterium marinum]|uniref:Imidazole glycerol phosphate synthase subunit hisF2 n=1 Tax=Planctobacterium marinum TaxID=1631968 RepID=A0AA48KVQ4_9ALTE|nr:putative imidazole glycerol phosphate synthase subunit hisF2 [Planctobacterium marinum]